MTDFNDWNVSQCIWWFFFFLCINCKQTSNIDNLYRCRTSFCCLNWYFIMYNKCDQSQNYLHYYHGLLLGNQKFGLLSSAIVFKCIYYFGNKNYETETETELQRQRCSSFFSHTMRLVDAKSSQLEEHNSSFMVHF